jgi:hypothetical protein
VNPTGGLIEQDLAKGFYQAVGAFSSMDVAQTADSLVGCPGC